MNTNVNHSQRCATVLQRTARGLSLLELSLSLVLVAMVGFGIASMMAMVSAGANASRDARSALQRTHATQIRLNTYIHPALALLQVDAAQNAFVLWLHDDRPGGRINLSEMRVFSLDTTTGVVSVEWVEFPSTWTAFDKIKADKEYKQDTNFLTEFAVHRAMGHVRSTPISDGVVAWSASYKTKKPFEARRIAVNIAVDRGDSPSLQTLMTFGLANYTKPRK